MTNLIRSELLKLRSPTGLRTVLIALAVVSVVQALAALRLVPLPTFSPLPTPAGLLSYGDTALVAAAVLGALSVAADRRGSGEVSMLLIEPRRERVVAARLAAVAVTTVVLAIATKAVVAVAAGGGGWLLGARFAITPAIVPAVAWQLVAVGLTGVVVMAAVQARRGHRRPVLFVLGWLLVAEPLIGAVDAVRPYTVLNLFRQVGGEASIHRLWAALLLVAYATILAAAGAFRLEHQPAQERIAVDASADA